MVKIVCVWALWLLGNIMYSGVSCVDPKYYNLKNIVLKLENTNNSLEILRQNLKKLELVNGTHEVFIVPSLVSTKDSDCASIYEDGYTESGVYSIWLTSGYRFLPIYCDMETSHPRTNKRGWMVIQRRYNGEVNFNRTWQEYVDGFGSPNGEYWIGLENIYQLAGYIHNSFSGRSLQVNLGDQSGAHVQARYENFKIYSSRFAYKLGTPFMITKGIRNGLLTSHGEKFSTYDNNNQESNNFGNCALNSGGGWWLDFGCSWSNLNARYPNKNEKMSKTAIYWEDWDDINSNNDALTNVSMKIQ